MKPKVLRDGGIAPVLIASSKVGGRKRLDSGHSAGEFRCNGVVRNLPELRHPAGVEPGDKLWLPAKKRVWIW